MQEYECGNLYWRLFLQWPGDGTTDHTIIVNNTLFGDDTLLTGSGEFQIQFFPNDGTVSGNLFENNILYTTGQGIVVNNPFPDPNVKFGHNLEFAPDANPTWSWENSTTFTDFASWQAASGDAQSLYADPQFVNPGGSPPICTCIRPRQLSMPATI